MGKTKQVLGVGEVLWDVFPDGPRFGGAPANFACCVAELGGDFVSVALASRVGADELGDRAIANLQEHGVDTTHVHASEFSTGQVDVQLDSEGKPSYRFMENPAWDHLVVNSEMEELARHADVICFGTLAQRHEDSRRAVQHLLKVAGPQAWRILDLNLRSPYWNAEIIQESLPLANALKLNDEELTEVAGILKLSGSPVEILRGILDQHAFRVIALTHGAEGSILMDDRGQISEQPGISVSVVDTVGAGDAFTATLALGLVAELPLAEIQRWATEVAAYVCTQPGGTPQFPPQFHLSEIRKES